MLTSAFFSQLKSHCSSLEMDTKCLKEMVTEDQSTYGSGSNKLNLNPMDINIDIFKENISNLSSNMDKISVQCKNNDFNGMEVKEGFKNMSMSQLLLKYKSIYNSNEKMNNHLKQHYIKFGEKLSLNKQTDEMTSENVNKENNNTIENEVDTSAMSATSMDLDNFEQESPEMSLVECTTPIHSVPASIGATPMTPMTPSLNMNMSRYTMSMLNISNFEDGDANNSNEESQILTNLSTYSQPSPNSSMISSKDVNTIGSEQSNDIEIDDSVLLKTPNNGKLQTKLINDTPPTPPTPAALELQTCTLITNNNYGGSSIYSTSISPNNSIINHSKIDNLKLDNADENRKKEITNKEFVEDEEDEDAILSKFSAIKGTKILDPRRNLILAQHQIQMEQAQQQESKVLENEVSNNVPVYEKEGWIPLIEKSEWESNAPVFLKLQIQFEELNNAIRKLNQFISDSLLSNHQSKRLESFSTDEMNQIIFNSSASNVSNNSNLKVISLGLVQMKRLEISNENCVKVYKVKRFY